MAFSKTYLVLVTLPHSYPASCSPANLTLPVPSIPFSLLTTHIIQFPWSVFWLLWVSQFKYLDQKIWKWHSHRKEDMWLMFFWVWVTSRWYLFLKLHVYWLASCRVGRFSHALRGEKSPTVLPSHEPCKLQPWLTWQIFPLAQYWHDCCWSYQLLPNLI